jgi:hypothetical protein
VKEGMGMKISGAPLTLEATVEELLEAYNDPEKMGKMTDLLCSSLKACAEALAHESCISILDGLLANLAESHRGAVVMRTRKIPPPLKAKETFKTNGLLCEALEMATDLSYRITSSCIRRCRDESTARCARHCREPRRRRNRNPSQRAGSVISDFNKRGGCVKVGADSMIEGLGTNLAQGKRVSMMTMMTELKALS